MGHYNGPFWIADPGDPDYTGPIEGAISYGPDGKPLNPGPVNLNPIPPFTFSGPGQPAQYSASNEQALNTVATTAQDRQQQIAAENSTIPIPYGRQSSGALIADVVFYNGNLVILALWGHGPVNQIETVYLDDLAPAAGVTVTNYDGTQVAADATLVAAYAAQSPPIVYTDILPNIAYSVVVLPPGFTSGFPRITAIIQGIKTIYDPRSGGSTGYFDNPALCLADLQVNTVYGAGGQVDWTSVGTAADACDAAVAGGEKRRTLGLVIDNPQTIDQWLEAMRAYAGCFLARNGALLTLIPDRPAASSYTFSEVAGASQAATCRVRNLKRRTKRDVPTVSAIRYTDTSVYPWRDVLAYAYADGVLAGTTPWRIREVAMPGITRGTQANREAIEQLNKLSQNDITLDIEAQDEALSVTVGDVTTATANVGFSGDVRVLNVQTPVLGRPVFNCEIYHAAVYSDSVATITGATDTSLPNPNAMAAPTALVINETVYLEQVNGNPIAGGFIYQSRFDCSWTPPAGQAYPLVYRIELIDTATGQKIRDEVISSVAYSTPPLQQGKTYTINVRARNPLGVESAVLTGAKASVGKIDIPLPVPAILSALALSTELTLAWTASPGVDTMRYEWRYFPNGTGSWSTATFLDRVDGLTAKFKGLPVGTHRFYVSPIDSVGQYAASFATIDVTIAQDANTFVQNRTFTSPTLTNMVAIPPVEGVWASRWATSVAGQTFNAGIGGTVNSVATPIDAVHASGTSKWQGESWDLGSTVAGQWTATISIVDISNGPAVITLETSPDGSTWTSQPGGGISIGTRFIRPVITDLTTGTMLITGPVTIQLTSVAKPERGQVTTSASVATPVQLTGRYSTKQDLQATPINSSAARSAVVDRILLHSQAGLMLNCTVPVGAFTNGVVQEISQAARTLLADDYLEYDFFIDSSSPAVLTSSQGGCNVIAGAFSLTGINDADGYDARTPATGLDALARGVWKSRKIALGAGAGSVTSSWRIHDTGQAVGDHKTLFRNIRVTNGAGVDRLVIWASAEPAVNNNLIIGIQTNLRCGPSNSFLLYAYTTSTGAQVAADVQWSFLGS